MSLISNLSQGSHGMFSKVGRFTYEKNHLLQQGENIINNKTKVKQVSKIPLMDWDDILKNNGLINQGPISTEKQINLIKKKLESQQQLNQQDKKRNKILENQQQLEKKKNEPFGKSISRQYIEHLQQISKYDNQAVYTPKYEFIQKKEPTFVLKKKQQKNQKNQSQLVQSEKNDDIQLPDIINSPSHLRLQKIVGPIEFDRQLGRQDLLNYVFSTKNLTDIDQYQSQVNISINKSQQGIDLSKIQGRKSLTEEVEQRAVPIYDPNYDVLFPRKDLGNLDFSKMTIRKPNKNYLQVFQSQFMFNPDDLKYQSKSLLHTKIRVPHFSRQAPRYKSPDSGLPSFMQGLVSRAGIQNQSIDNSPKRLEKNNKSQKNLV